MSLPHMRGCMTLLMLMTHADIKKYVHPSRCTLSHTQNKMQCSINVRASSLECESCGGRNKRMLSNEYTCMSCGVIDGQVMIVDEMSEQRKQWENNESDTHANKFGGQPIMTRPPRPTADTRVLKVAKSASSLFSIETDQIPQEATSMYMATAANGHISKVRVIACTMITAHRRTARDIQDVALAFSLKPKSVSGAIEAIQALVLTGDKHLGEAFGYLFWTGGERRTSLMVKEALDQLTGCCRTGERQLRERDIWGIRALADDMMKHIQDCRMIGGDSLEILARALILMACELMGLSTTAPADYISSCMMNTHRATWRAALRRWPTGPVAFDAHVARRVRLNGGGPRSAANPVDMATDGVIQGKRLTRSQVSTAFGQDRYRTLRGTSVAAGVTHMCVSLVSRDVGLKAFVTTHGIDCLIEVCLAAVRRTRASNTGLVTLVEAVAGFQYELSVARNFRQPIANSSACFIPRELMRWGLPGYTSNMPATKHDAQVPRRTSVFLPRSQ